MATSPVNSVVPITEKPESMDTAKTASIHYGQRVDGDPRRRVNITIRGSVHDLMAAMAADRGFSRSRLLETLLIDASERVAG